MRLSWPQRRAHQKSRPPRDRRRSSLRFLPRLEALEQRLAPAALVVNTAQDEDDASNGTINPPDGPDKLLSLREAINWANKVGGPSSISFAVPQVNVGSSLPTITVPLTITGGGVQIVGPGTFVDGLVFQSSGNQVTGVAINSFSTCLLLNGGNNLIQDDFIGTNPGGTTAVGGSAGIVVMSGNNKILSNVVSGLGGNGVSLESSAAAHNLIAGNFIGTDKTGSNLLTNTGDGILFFTGTHDNTLGGTISSDRNIISGNDAGGIAFSGTTGNLVEGNYIGTDASGLKAIRNGGTPGGAGVDITGASSNNTIGGASAGAGNVISGNSGDGVLLETATNNLVQGNSIGVDATGAAALANGSSGVGHGVEIRDSSMNTIGGTTAGARNIISANTSNGVQIENTSPSPGAGNAVVGNYIGTDKGGSIALGNKVNGITIASPNNTIGGAGAGNVVSGNGSDGVFFLGSAVSKTLVEGNYIGLNASGTASLANRLSGVDIQDGMMNTIGGTTAGARNVISGNASVGVYIHSTSASMGSGNLVAGNYIGTDKGGAAALGNAYGVYIGGGAPNNSIGGTTSSARNIISGNGYGIELDGTTRALVEGNYVGTDTSGAKAVANTSSGIVLFDSSGATTDNTIGGASAGAGNVVSGNAGDAVFLDGSNITQNQVQGNTIGLNAAGTAAIANHFNGVEILDGLANSIGGTAVADRNIISGNAGAGVYIHATAAGRGDGNVVEGNFIGTDTSGTKAFGNAFGVYISGGASNNSIGGTTAGAGNIIAFSVNSGVVVGQSATDQAVGNAIRQNSILGNMRPGIDLGNDGVTLNHEGAAPPGPNQLQNHPVLASLTTTPAGTVAGFELRAKANTQYQMDFFSNTQRDPSWYGQGQKFLKSDTRTTDANGYVKFTEMLPVSALVTATATDPNGNTSEFSSFVDVGSLGASLPSTGNPIAGGSPPRPAPGMFTTTNSALDFQPAMPNDMLVVMENAGAITVTANQLNVAAAPIRWQIDRNPTDVVGTAADLPTLSTQMGATTIVTPDQPGSFRLICYLDADGNGKYEAGEELKVLRLVIIKAIVQPGASITKDPNFAWGAPEPNGVSPTGNAMKFQAQVLLEGGGANEMLGVNDLRLGEVGNVVADSFKVTYPGTPAHPQSGTGTEDPDFKINPAPGFANPMVDSSRIALGGQATGGFSPFRSTSDDSHAVPGPGGRGEVVTVTSQDTPTVGWSFNHPTTTNPWGTTSGNNDFREYLVAFSTTFIRNYMVLGRGGYTITFAGNNVAGKWHNTGSSDVITNFTTAAFPKTGDAAGIQVLGYSYVREFGMKYIVPAAAGAASVASTISGGASLGSLSTATGGVSLPALSVNSPPVSQERPGTAMSPAALSPPPAKDATPGIRSAEVSVARRLRPFAKSPDRGAWDVLDSFFAQDLLE
jgi:CSLREA domain-containing protein